eukprot:9868235-Lingulodinium_polyedra.AAC.1
MLGTWCSGEGMHVAPCSAASPETWVPQGRCGPVLPGRKGQPMLAGRRCLSAPRAGGGWGACARVA